MEDLSAHTFGIQPFQALFQRSISMAVAFSRNGCYCHDERVLRISLSSLSKTRG